MSGKIEFGFDYLMLMRSLQWRGRSASQQVDLVADAAARLFLLQWGFSVQEIDEANQVFWDRASNLELPEDLRPIVMKIVEHISDDRASRERLVTELAAIGAMDGNITRDEEDFIYWFRELLDMRPSEFQALLDRGSSWAVGLNYFGKQFAEIRGTASPYHPQQS